MALQAIFWNFRGNLSFGQFDDPFDVVIFGEKGQHSEHYVESKTPVSYVSCPGFTNVSWQNFETLQALNDSCVAKNCTIVARFNQGNATLNGSRCMRKQMDFPRDLVLLDGSDFFDIAYDRYRSVFFLS